MYEIGLSTCDKLLDEALFIEYKSAGITAMEVCLTKEEYDTLDFSWLKSTAEKYAIKLNSLHLPFYPADKINMALADTKDETVEYYKALISRANEAGISLFVLHSGSGEIYEEKDRGARMENAKESLLKLAEFAEAIGVTIAVEPLPRTCLGNTSKEIEELISVHSGVKICLDTNHLQNESTVDFIYKFGNKIVTTHVSDFDFINERHWLPGEGKQDFKGILKALSDVGYSGPWLYEVEFACPPTILRDRALTCADIARNADEVLNDKPMTINSKPKPNLGMWR